MARKPNAPKAEKTDAEKAAAKVAKATKFKELGAKRMTATLKQIGLLGNLSSRGSYDYSEEQIAKMRGAILKQVEETFARFSATAKAENKGFEF